ncbi:hypothetical protein [Bradyrhizobium sp. RDT46]|uniref:hypothetical protein n=1 Tax=Bradyrhizobium sp. RDT46 TaxID=3341829 RepID=UPI0035C720C3
MTFRVARSIAAWISVPASPARLRRSLEEPVRLTGRRCRAEFESGELRACHRRLRRLRVALVEIVDRDEAIGFRNRAVAEHLIGQHAADQHDAHARDDAELCSNAKPE